MSADRQEASTSAAPILVQPLNFSRRLVIQQAQLDVLQLLARYLIFVRDHPEAPICFTAFKEVWKQIGFSHLFQACPSRLGLPAFVTAIYEFLLEIMRTEALPYPLILALGPIVEEPSGQDAAGTSEGASEPPPPPRPNTGRIPHNLRSIEAPEEGHLPKEDLEYIVENAIKGPLIVATAVYCLYCVYYAQPGPTIVKIRLSREDQEMVLAMAHRFLTCPIQDPLLLLRRLHEDNAIVPGSSQTPWVPPVEVAGERVGPGVAASYVTPGLKGEEAATLREVRFHLDSTLTGLGTKHLDPLCRGYGEMLEGLWNFLGDQEESVGMPEGVADLSLGHWIHEYAIEKSKEVHVVLYEGPNWRTKQKKGKKPKGEGGASTSAAAAAETPQSTKQQRRRRRSSAAAVPKDVEEAAGVPGVARQVMAREAARRADMARRSQPWAERMGVENVAAEALQTRNDMLAGSEDEDMPLIPGVASLHAHLAGPSADKVTSRAGGSTVQQESQNAGGKKSGGSSGDEEVAVSPAAKGRQKKKKEKTAEAEEEKEEYDAMLNAVHTLVGTIDDILAEDAAAME